MSRDPKTASAERGAVLAPLPRLLTSREAAKVLSISPRKLWSLTAGGEIPHVRIGRSVRYSMASLSEWIDSRTVRGQDS